MSALERAFETVRQSGAEPQGDVAFGLPSSIAMVLSVPLAETVRLELPKVRLCAIDAMSRFIQTWLEDQSIDLGMLYDVSAVRHLSHSQLMTEEMVCRCDALVPPRHMGDGFDVVEPATGQAFTKIVVGNHIGCTLELGGKSPKLVFADTDLDAAHR